MGGSEFSIAGHVQPLETTGRNAAEGISTPDWILHNLSKAFLFAIPKSDSLNRYLKHSKASIGLKPTRITSPCSLKQNEIKI